MYLVNADCAMGDNSIFVRARIDCAGDYCIVDYVPVSIPS